MPDKFINATLWGDEARRVAEQTQQDIERLYSEKITRLDQSLSLIMDKTNYMLIKNTAEELANFLENAPAADVQPVIHAEWMHYPTELTKRCSHCRHVTRFYNDHERAYAYCPHCGAKMDGGNKNENA